MLSCNYLFIKLSSSYMPGLSPLQFTGRMVTVFTFCDFSFLICQMGLIMYLSLRVVVGLGNIKHIK